MESNGHQICIDNYLLTLITMYFQRHILKVRKLQKKINGLENYKTGIIIGG